jgi:hypothetical protein
MFVFSETEIIVIGGQNRSTVPLKYVQKIDVVKGENIINFKLRHLLNIKMIIILVEPFQV